MSIKTFKQSNSSVSLINLLVKVVCKHYHWPNQTKQSHQIYRSFSNTDFLHTYSIYSTYIDKCQ